MSHPTINTEEMVNWIRAPIRNLNLNAWKCGNCLPPSFPPEKWDGEKVAGVGKKLASTILRHYNLPVCNPKQWQVSENVVTDSYILADTLSRLRQDGNANTIALISERELVVGRDADSAEMLSLKTAVPREMTMSEADQDSSTCDVDTLGEQLCGSNTKSVTKLDYHRAQTGRMVNVEMRELGGGGFTAARRVGLHAREQGEKWYAIGLRFVLLPSLADATGWEVLDVRLWVSIKQVEFRNDLFCDPLDSDFDVAVTGNVPTHGWRSHPVIVGLQQQLSVIRCTNCCSAVEHAAAAARCSSH